MFSVGDIICYPMHGVGVVEAIERHTVLGESGDYYSLRFTSGRMTALVPVATAEKVGLRSPIDASECDAVISYMQQEGQRGSDNWNQRYRENLDKLRSGSIYDVADVVKCLRLRDSEKGLSAGERKMLVMARGIIVSELATVMKKELAAVEAQIG